MLSAFDLRIKKGLNGVIDEIDFKKEKSKVINKSDDGIDTSTPPLYGVPLIFDKDTKNIESQNNTNKNSLASRQVMKTPDIADLQSVTAKKLKQ